MQTSASTYALVIDDHPLVAQGIEQLLMRIPPIDKVTMVSSAAEGLSAIAATGAPLMVMMDFWLEEGSSTHFVANILTLAPQTRVLMMSGDNHPTLAGKVRAAGAHGLVHKSCTPEQFMQVVKDLLGGAPWVEHISPQLSAQQRASSTQLSMSGRELGLTQRQTQVLDLILKGKPNKAIAQALNLSEYTVKEHVTAILQKLECTNRVELITQLQGVDLQLIGSAVG